MRDEYDARFWDEHHKQFSNDLGRLLSAIRVTFCKMVRIQYRAPWKPEPTDAC